MIVTDAPEESSSVPGSSQREIDQPSTSFNSRNGCQIMLDLTDAIRTVHGDIDICLIISPNLIHIGIQRRAYAESGDENRPRPRERVTRVRIKRPLRRKVLRNEIRIGGAGREACESD